MTRVVTEAIVDQETLAGALAERDGLVAEQAVGQGRFEATDGPFAHYRRIVAIEHLADGHAAVRQTVTYRLRIPFFGPLFAPGYRRQLGRVGAVPSTVWWAPPRRLGLEAFATLARLAALSMVTGYLSTLLTQTMTFSAQEFGANKAAQGVALAVARADVVLSVGLVVLADRRGRRAVTIWSAAVGSALTALGALSPSLPWLVASQVAARGFVTAVTITVAILAAETMPAGCRAWAVGVISMASALGSGVCVLLLPIAGLSTPAWRALYALGIFCVPISLLIGRHLPESRRFLAEGRAKREAAGPIDKSTSQRFRQRLLLLATGSFLFNLFFLPAAQFRNEFLRKERFFSATHITFFIVVTVVPGALGILFGGRLADTRGRRVIGTISLLGGTVATVASYFTRGWPMWGVATAGTVVGAAVVPALSVYGSELFPTARRGLANAIITGVGRIGSVIGLVVVGVLASTLGTFGPAFALVALGPVSLAVLVVLAFPETAGRELEELNPEDCAPPPTLPSAWGA